MMESARAAAALLVLAACLARSAAAPVNEQTGLDLYDSGAHKDGCYYNFQHYGEGDRIMTNEPCLNCTCHNRMLMCYLRVCPFTKPVGQDCTIEKRGDQCCPVITCPDVHVDLLTSTSTTSPAEYGSTDLGHLEKYGCTLGGKFFSEGSKMPSTPNKPCELCYCIRNMTACVMQECTLHVDGCTPVYHKDVCCPVRYSCDHPEDGVPMLDDMSTTVRPTTGFLLTTTVPPGVTQDCIHHDEMFADGALIKTEKACEHCYCMKGDIVCVVQECGTPMENEGKNCTSMPPRQGQCCPDTYICEGDTNIEDTTNELLTTFLPTQAPTRRSDVEGSGDDRTNKPYATTLYPESEKEGSGSEETNFPDALTEENSEGAVSEPATIDDKNVYDVTTDTTTESEDKIVLNKSETPTEEKTFTTETTIERETSKPVENDLTTMRPVITSSELGTTSPSIKDITDTSDLLNAPDKLTTTEPLSEIDKKTGSMEGSTPTLVQKTEPIESVSIQTTNADQTQNSDDQSTAITNMHEGQSTEYTIAMDGITTEKDYKQLTTEHIDQPSESLETTISETHAGDNDLTTERLNERFTEKIFDQTTENTAEKTSQKQDEGLTENINKETSDKINYQTTEQINETSEKSTEKPIDATSEKLDEHSTEKSTQDDSKITDYESTEKEKIEETSEKMEYQTTGKTADETSEHLGEQSTEKIPVLTSEKSDEQSTEKVIDEPTKTNDEQTTEKIVDETTDRLSEQSTENIVEAATEKLGDQSTEKDSQVTNVEPHDIFTERISQEATLAVFDKQFTEKTTYTTNEQTYEATSKSVDNPSTEMVLEQTSEKIEKTTEFTVEESTEKIGKTTEVQDQSTEKIGESFTEQHHKKTTVVEQLTEKYYETSTKNIDVPSTDKLHDQFIASSEPSVTDKIDEDVSSTETFSQEGSGDSKSTEISDEKYATTTNIPFEKTKSSEAVGVVDTISSTETTNENLDLSSTSKDLSTATYYQSHTTPKYTQEPEISQTKHESELSFDDLTKIPPTISDDTEINISTTDSNLDVTKSTDNIISVQLEEFTTATSKIYEPTESSSIKNNPNQTTQITKQEQADKTKTTSEENKIEKATESSTEIKTTPNELESTQEVLKTEKIPELPSIVSVTPEFTESTSERTDETLIPSKEAIDADKIKDDVTVTEEVNYSTTDSIPMTTLKESVSKTVPVEISTSTSKPSDDNDNAQLTTIAGDSLVTSEPDESENEIHEDEHAIGSILPQIPGEGDCLVDGKTYTNDSVIPSTNKCQSSCKCVSSIVKCDQIQCSPPPENMINCQPMYDAKESCCPTYICDHAKETVAPESHNQMLDVTTLTPSLEKETPTKPQCGSTDCQAIEEVIVPVIVPECTSDSCSQIPVQTSVPHRSSDENVPIEEIPSPAQDCSSSECIQEPAVLPNQENIDSAIVPVIIGTPEECSGETCTPKRKKTEGEPHLQPISPDAQLPVVVCTEEGCQQSSDACSNDDCKTPLEQYPKETVAPICTGDKCDLPQSPVNTVNEDCKGDDCKNVTLPLPEVQLPADTKCIGDECNFTQTETQESISPEDCQSSGDCKKTDQSVPQLHEQSTGVSCEGDCNLSAVVPEVSSVCNGLECKTSGEVVTQTPISSACTGDVCDSKDSSSEQCNGNECKENPLQPEIVHQAPCEGHLCGSQDTSEPQTVTPEICQNGDCGKPDLDSSVTDKQSTTEIPCTGGQCDIQGTQTSEIDNDCETDDCKQPELQKPSEVPVDVPCTGDLCGVPHSVPSESTASNSCNSDDCKESGFNEQATEETPVSCIGTDCQTNVIPQKEAELTTIAAEVSVFSTVLPNVEVYQEQTPLVSIETPKTTAENELPITSTEVATTFTEQTYSESKVPDNLPNDIYDSNQVQITTKIPEPVELESTSSTADKNIEPASETTEKVYATDESITTPADTQLNEIPKDNTNDQLTPEELPQTDSTLGEATEQPEIQFNKEIVTEEPIISSTDVINTDSPSTETKFTDDSKTQNIQPIESKPASTTELLLAKTSTTAYSEIIEPHTSSSIEPSVEDKFTENTKSPETTSRPEVEQFTETLSAITQGENQQKVETDDTRQGITSGLTTPETTTAYSVELEQHSHAANDQETTSQKPIDLSTDEETEITTSGFREQITPEIQSHKIDTEVTESIVEPHEATIQPEIVPESISTEKTQLTEGVTESSIGQDNLTEFSNFETTPTSSQKEITDMVETEPETEPSDGSGKTEKPDLDKPSQSAIVTEMGVSSTETLNELEHTNPAQSITESSKSSTDIPLPIESSTSPTSEYENTEFDSSIIPVHDDIKPEVTTISEIGSEQTESINTSEENFPTSITETAEESLQTTSPVLEEVNVVQPQINTPHSESSTSKSDVDISTTVLPKDASFTQQSIDIKPENMDDTRKVMVPGIEKDSEPTEVSQVPSEKETEKATVIPENFTSTPFTAVNLDKTGTEGSDGSAILDEPRTQEPQIITTESPLESESVVTEVSENTSIMSLDQSEIEDKFKPEQSTEKPVDSNEIPKQEFPSKEQFTTLSVPHIVVQSEHVTQSSDLMTKSESEPTSFVDKDSESGKITTDISELVTEKEESTFEKNPSSSQSTITTASLGVAEEHITLDPETVLYEKTTSKPSNTDATVTGNYVSHQEADMYTTVSGVKDIPDNITEILTEKPSFNSDHLSTTNDIDASQTTLSEPITEFYESSSPSSPEVMPPATEQSISKQPELEEEITKLVVPDKKTSDGLTETTDSLSITSSTEEKPGSISLDHSTAPTTTKQFSLHDEEFISSTDQTKITALPTSLPEAQSNVEIETEKPESPIDEKPMSTPSIEDEQKPTTSGELPGGAVSPGDLPSPGEDIDHQSPNRIPTPGYGTGDQDYEEEDQAFGPGTCRYGGKVYVSAQQIPRDDPCDFCFCFRSDIICLQQSCPPPIHGCHEEPISGFCCPRYECPVSMATTLNVTTTTTTTTTTLPPHFPSHAYKGAAQRRGCHIKGHSYQVGEVVRASSGPCLHCTCGGDGQMKCDPKVCTPEPMLRQMIAAAVSTKRRR